MPNIYFFLMSFMEERRKIWSIIQWKEFLLIKDIFILIGWFNHNSDIEACKYCFFYLFIYIARFCGFSIQINFWTFLSLTVIVSDIRLCWKLKPLFKFKLYYYRNNIFNMLKLNYVHIYVNPTSHPWGNIHPCSWASRNLQYLCTQDQLVWSLSLSSVCI